MKKLSALVLVVLMSSGSFASFSNVSVRMQGINPSLVGIIADEYSDPLSINPSDLLNVSGYRVFTNMSNLYGAGNLGNDSAFSGTTTGGAGLNQFLLGGFGNPLSKLPFIGRFTTDVFPTQMGVLYNGISWETATPATDATTTPGWELDTNNDGFAETTGGTNVPTNPNGEGSFTQILDEDVNSLSGVRTYREVVSSAKHTAEASTNDFNILSAVELGPLKIGAGIIATGMEPTNRAVSGREIDNLYVKETSRTAIASYIRDELEQKGKNEKTNTNNTIQFGARFSLLENLDIGGVANVSLESYKNDPSVDVVLSQDQRALSLLNTGDIDRIYIKTNDPTWLITFAGNFGWGAGNNAPVRCALSLTDAQIDDDGDGEVNEDDVDGLDNDGDGLVDEDPMDRPAALARQGTGMSIAPDVHFKLSDNVKLVGRVILRNSPLTVEQSSIRNRYAKIEDADVYGAGTGTGTVITDNNLSTTYSGNQNINTMGVTFGTEAKLVDNIILGAGVVLMNTVSDIDLSVSQTRNDKTLTDTNGDGDYDEDPAGPGIDRIDTQTETGAWKSSAKTTDNTVQIPIGLEMRKWKKFAVRLGVTHQIRMRESVSSRKDGTYSVVTITQQDGGAAMTTTYGSSTLYQNDQTLTSKTTTRTTQYYYGIGYDWSENVSFDILGVAGGWAGGGGFNLFDLSTWRISCILKF